MFGLQGQATNARMPSRYREIGARLDRARHRSTELGEQVVRSGERDDLEGDHAVVRVARDDEALLALLGVLGQGAVRETVAVGLVDDPHDAARGDDVQGPEAVTTATVVPSAMTASAGTTVMPAPGARPRRGCRCRPASQVVTDAEHDGSRTWW